MFLNTFRRLTPYAARVAHGAVRALPEVAPVVFKDSAVVSGHNLMARFFQTASRQGASRRVLSVNTSATTMPLRRLTLSHIDTKKIAIQMHRNWVKTFLSSWNSHYLSSGKLISIAAVCAASSAYYYEQTKSSTTKVVVTDKVGNHYLFVSSEQLIREDETGQIKTLRELSNQINDSGEEQSPMSADYCYLFPIIETETGELTVNYRDPVAASFIGIDEEEATEILGCLATHESFEGRGLGSVLVLYAAEGCAARHRDFEGSPTKSALSFYTGIFNRCHELMGGANGVLDIDRYTEGDAGVLIPFVALKVLVEIYKLSLALNTSPTPAREALSKHPELVKAHSDLQLALEDREKLLEAQSNADDRLFSRI